MKDVHLYELGGGMIFLSAATIAVVLWMDWSTRQAAPTTATEYYGRLIANPNLPTDSEFVWKCRMVTASAKVASIKRERELHRQGRIAAWVDRNGSDSELGEMVAAEERLFGPREKDALESLLQMQRRYDEWKAKR